MRNHVSGLCIEDVIERLVRYRGGVLSNFWRILSLKSVQCLVRVLVGLIAFFTLVKIARKIFITGNVTSGAGNAR